MGSVQKDMVKRVSCGVKLTRGRSNESISLTYPTSNPVDSATSKAAQNEHSEQENLQIALIGGRYDEKVSRPQASARRMT
jgi:hypothetical protein